MSEPSLPSDAPLPEADGDAAPAGGEAADSRARTADRDRSAEDAPLRWTQMEDSGEKLAAFLREAGLR